MARAEAEAGTGARRGGLHRLSPTPADDGYGDRRRLSQGPVPAGTRHPARLGAGPAGRARRSADARDTARSMARRASTRADAKTILNIPAVPISWGDAQGLPERLWADLWRRRVGAAPCRSPITSAADPRRPTHLVVFSNWNQAPLYDVDRHDEGRAKNRTNGSSAATTATAGCSAPRIRCRARPPRWKRPRPSAPWPRPAGGPNRTIIYTSWDGEEPGLLGSTEWAETHAKELQRARGGLHQHRRQRPRPAVGRGQLRPAARWSTASPPMCADPETKVSVRERALAEDPGQTPWPPAPTAELRRPRCGPGRPPGAISRSAISGPDRTTPRSCSISASPRSISAIRGGGRVGRRLPLGLRQLSTTSREVWRSGVRLRRGAGARPRAVWSCGRRTPRSDAAALRRSRR